MRWDKEQGLRELTHPPADPSAHRKLSERKRRRHLAPVPLRLVRR